MSGKTKTSRARGARRTAIDSIASIEDFARHYHLRLGEEPCGDKIVPGYPGSHLFFDRGSLCWMVEGPVKLAKRVGHLLRSTADKFWNGENAYDLDCRGIPPVLYRKIINLSGARRTTTGTRKERHA